MPTNPSLHSDRFTLIPIRDTADSNGHLIEMMQDEKVQRYITGSAFTDQQVVDGLERFHRLNNVNGQGFWLIYDSADNCVGMCLLKPMPTREETGNIETGYWLKPAYWGQGIAAEVAARLIEYAFEDLQLPRVTAVVDEQNIASAKSLLRAGLLREGTIIAYDTELPFFLLSREQYFAKANQHN
ncbi:MAG: GNAT family N-acetyltransferase [Pseudomonadales bacterium]|nr:GNAT family N-acetyltransferase [Pseudomonadales bacterium]NRA13961.1 GNAT family N-acetyltransferase [Oceanospirillaceae bacterium]